MPAILSLITKFLIPFSTFRGRKHSAIDGVVYSQVYFPPLHHLLRC
jgi:hypothetical protein